MSVAHHEPAPASTVILIREKDDDIEVYLLKRSKESGFMAGNYVFPGGTVDAEDRETDKWRDHMDMKMNAISARLGGILPVEDVLAHAVAAVRETLEEAGVFLARKETQSEEDTERLRRLRTSTGLSSDWFLRLVVSEKWTLEFSRLARWAHWITPEGMPKRYDTRFFVAFMPPGQTCVPDDWETTHGLWIRPREGLEKNLNGEIPLSPPTLLTLHELLNYPSSEKLREALENRPWGEPRIPRVIPTPRGPVILQPWDPSYRDVHVEIPHEALRRKCLPPDASFSRIWRSEGIWRPVAV